MKYNLAIYKCYLTNTFYAVIVNQNNEVKFQSIFKYHVEYWIEGPPKFMDNPANCNASLTCILKVITNEDILLLAYCDISFEEVKTVLQLYGNQYT